jgi:MFS family permease
MQSRLSSLNYCLLYAIGTVVYFVLPVWGGIFSEDLLFNTALIGWLLSADMIANAIANVTARYWITRGNWRRTALGFITLIAAANLMCIGVEDFVLLMILRLMAGFAGGGLTSLAVAGIARSGEPDRYFGIALSIQVFMGGLLLFASPSLLGEFGNASIYIALAMLALIAIPFLRTIPNEQLKARLPIPETDKVPFGVKTSVQFPVILPFLGFFGVILFFAGMNSIWAFAENIGTQLGIEEQFIATTLSLSLLISMGGSLFAAYLAGKVKRLAPIVLGVSSIALAVISFFWVQGNWAFFVAINVFNFGYNFVIPFQSGWIASFDIKGENIVLLPAVQGAGISIGPVLSGFIINDISYLRAIYPSSILLIASIIIFIVLKSRQSSLGISSLHK